MTSETKTWHSLKSEYLRQVAKALSSVRHPRSKEVLEDVRSHLDRRFAELEPEEQTWENFQAIITEMGPACDYAELLEPAAGPLHKGVWQKHLLWLGLAAVLIVATAILWPKTEQTFPETLNEAQRLYMDWTESQFESLLDRSKYAGVAEAEKKGLEEKWLKMLEGRQGNELNDAINCLAAIKSQKATKPLLRIAAERRQKDNRGRWMATRALGIVGDESVVPELIPLVYHYNQNTRFWAQISLVRLTGINFGSDWQAWGQWWNKEKGDPSFSGEKVTWTSKADWADEKYLEEEDRAFIDHLKAGKNGVEKPSAETYIVSFKPVSPFEPQTAKELLDAFNEKHPRGIRTHHYRTKIQDGKLVGYICVDTEGGKDAVAKMLDESKKLALVSAELANQRELEGLNAMRQVSLRTEEIYIVTFKPVVPFAPQTSRELLDAFNEKHPRGVRTHHYRTRVEDDRLVGYICVDTKAGKDAVVSMLEKSEKLTFVEAKLATDEDLKKLYEMSQVSLKESASKKNYCALPTSPNRKLLDEQTRIELASHERFSAGWFKVEQVHEAASESEKNKMVEQWIADAASDDFDKMTRAIAALGNVAAKEAVDVLMKIAQKPKKGNRPRWMAVRALGRIGDMAAVPLLINLLDHYNKDTRLYARVALCEITGVYFGDSKGKWTNWAGQKGIEVKVMGVGQKNVTSTRSRTPRTRPPSVWYKTVSRTGNWPDGHCSVRGNVYRKVHNSRVDHAKLCLSSEEFGTWIAETYWGNFEFDNIPAGVYTLRTTDTFGYEDTYYNPEKNTSELPTFQIKDGQRRQVQIEIKPSRPYRQITGRILDESGEPIKNSGLSVYAWVKQPQGWWKGHYYRIYSSTVNDDGSYKLDNLDGRPVYVQVVDWSAPQNDQAFPPRFYPGTFSRSEATLITFGEEDVIENIDIPMKKTGGLVLQGLVTDESTGRPIPEALVSIFHFDMFFDLFCAYTDEQGHYEIQGLGEGKFIVHVDAVHKRFIKTRKLVNTEPDAKETQLDFALRRGVRISGRFVDDEGNAWKVGRNFGSTYVKGKPGGGPGSNFMYGNTYAPPYIREGNTIFSEAGQGDHPSTMMVFPTESSFLLPAVMPGKTFFNFHPRGKGERLLEILHQGEDIAKTGLVTEAGQEIEGVTIVIGTP